jgi:hypothetical protein
MRTAYVVAVFLLACSALGGTITSLDPPSILTKSGEYFMTVNGSSLAGNVVYDGPAGNFELETSASGAGYVIAWVPMEIVNAPGTYSVTVGDSNKVTFSVTKPGFPVLKLHLPELLADLAKTRLGTIIDYEVTATGPDPDTTKIECDPRSGSTFPFGRSLVKCIATDALGNRDDGVIDVNVWDGTAPVLEVPKSFEVPADDERGAFVKYDTHAFDEIDGELLVTCLPKSESLFVPGRTTVNCEAADAALNPAYGSFDVFVQPRDPGKLALQVPEKVVEVAADPEGGEVFFEVTAYGSADPDPVVECTPPSGWFFPMKETKVYCSAEDDFGQRAEAGFIVEVVERLALKFPDVTAEATSPSGTEVTWEPVAEDWSNAITCTPGPGSLFALGATSVDCESADDRGRRAGGTFMVNVADTIAPHIGGIRANARAAAGDVVPVQVAVEAIDAADAMPRCSVTALTADAGDTFDWRVKSDLEVEIRTGANRAFRIQVSCVDASGNRSTDSVAVSLGGTRRRPTR